MKLPSEFLMELMEKNSIKGMMIFLSEEPDGDVTVSHATKDVHEINITQGLAALLLERQMTRKDSNWKTVIKNSLETIIASCEMINDLASSAEEDENQGWTKI